MGAYLYWIDAAAFQSKILWFDVVTEETHNLAAEATESPVEVGVDITDHVRPKVARISLSAFVSNTPIYSKTEIGAYLGQKGEIFDKLIGAQDGEVTSTALQPPTPPASSPFAVIATLASLIQNAISPAKQYAVNTLQFPAEFNNVKDVYDALETIRQTSQTLSVVTSTKTYANMIIEDLTMTRTSDTGTGATFKLDLKEIRIVSAKQVAVILPKETNGNPVVDKGSKNTKNVHESVLFKGFSAIGNYANVDIFEGYTGGGQ